MHLSEIEKMDDMLPVLCKMVEPMTAISNDDVIANALREALKGVSHASNSMAQAIAMLPLQCSLLERHRQEIVQMVALTTGRNVEDVEKQAPDELLGDVRRLITGDFLCFFK